MIFLERTQKVQTTKTKLDKQDYIKLRSFCPPKRIINSAKRFLPGWEKILANYLPHKGLICRIYQEVKILKSNGKIHLRNGQRTWIDSSQNMKCKWSTKSLCKNTQYHLPTWKPKPKPQWEVTSLLIKGDHQRQN